MKVPAGRADAFSKNPDSGVRAVLVYGPDAGLVRERCKTLIKSVLGPDDKDPFRFAELSPSTLKEDPSRLVDEAAAMALTGGRRVVLVRDAADTISSAAEDLLNAPASDTLVVLEGGDLPPRSSLRKLFEGESTFAAVPCYADDGRAIDQLIEDTVRAAKLSIDRDARDWLLAHLGGDRALTRQELDKLVVYKGGAGADDKTITVEDVLACVGDTADLGLDDLSLAVADGDRAESDRIFGRLVAEGLASAQILSAVARHFMRLHQARAHMDGGKQLDQALQTLRPPVFFKVKGRMQAQVRAWTMDKLDRALEVLNTAEMQVKSTDMPADAITSRTLMQLCTAAKRR